MQRKQSSGLVLAVHDLMYHPGKMRVVNTEVPAPADLGTEMMKVPESSPVDLDLRLESVSEGILVSGTVEVDLEGSCVRCLDPITEGYVADVQELFVNPDSEIDDEDIPRIVEDAIDLQPLLRDHIVLELPFSPLCDEDCPGLCQTCGAHLADDPSHSHGDATDARWSNLAQWTSEDKPEGER